MTGSVEKNGLVDLQKALDEFPRHSLAKEERDQCPICVAQERWHENVVKLFSVFQRERENVDLKGLEQKAKAFGEIDREIQMQAIRSEKSALVRYLPRELFNKRWVSLEDVKSFLMNLLHEKVLAEEKNVEYAKLVASQAQEYAEKLRDKVLVDRKQLSDELAKRQKDFEEYGRLAHWKKKNATEDDKISRVCWHRIRDEIDFMKELLYSVGDKPT